MATILTALPGRVSIGKTGARKPWANIGYWGDHQVIYLSKLIELAQNHFPRGLEGLLACDVFAYANVPYRIKGFEALLANPYETIAFDQVLDDGARRVEEVGADGRLLWVDDNVYQVNLLRSCWRRRSPN